MSAVLSEGVALQIFTPAVFEPYLAPARYKGLHGGRYSMKSHHHAEGVIERCVQDASTRVACLRETQKSLRFSSKQLLQDKIRQFNAGYYFDVQDKVIRLHGGKDGVIIFEGLQDHTAESVKSLEGFDVFWVTEAQAITQRSLEILRPTARRTPRMSREPEMWFDWNPRMRSDAVDMLFRGGKPPPSSICLRVNWRDNPWLTDEMLADILADRERDADIFEHVWEGGYYVDHANQLVAYAWILAARDRGMHKADGTPGWDGDGSEPRLRVCVDVADGGVDRTVVSAVLQFQSFDVLVKQRSFHFPPAKSPVMAAEEAEKMFEEFAGRPEVDDFVVDANGVGAGTAGTLIMRKREDGKRYRVIRYIGGAAGDNIQRYRNRRAQSHIVMRDRFRDGRLIIDEDAFDDQKDWLEFVDQVVSVRRKPGTERVEELETKEHLVQRTGKSPDRCESLAMYCATQLPERQEVGDDSVFVTPSVYSGGSIFTGGGSALAGYDGGIRL